MPQEATVSPSRAESPVMNVDLLELGLEDSLSTTGSSEGQTSFEGKTSAKDKFRKKLNLSLSNVRDHEIENVVRNFQQKEEPEATERPEREQPSLPTTAMEQLDKGDEAVALDTLKSFAVRTFAVFVIQTALIAGWLTAVGRSATLYTRVYAEAEMVVALSAIAMFGIFGLVLRANPTLQDQQAHWPLVLLQVATTSYAFGATSPFFQNVTLGGVAAHQLSGLLGVLAYLVISREKFLNTRKAAISGITAVIITSISAFTLDYCSLWEIFVAAIISSISCLAWLIRFVAIADRSKHITPIPLQIKHYTFASMLLFVELMRLLFQVFVVLADKSSDKIMPHVAGQKGAHPQRRRMFRFMTNHLEREKDILPTAEAAPVQENKHEPQPELEFRSLGTELTGEEYTAKHL